MRDKIQELRNMSSYSRLFRSAWDNSSLFHKKTDRGREFLPNALSSLKLQAFLTLEVMMTGSQSLKEVFARNEWVPPYVEKYSMVIATNLTSICCLFKKKIVKTTNSES